MVESAVVPHDLAGPIAPAPGAPTVIPEKFKNADGTTNVEALTASYVALEAAQGGKVVEPVVLVTDPAVETSSADDADETSSTVTYGKAVDDALASADLTPAAVNAEWQKDGKLSEETFGALAKAGFSKDVVDQYIAGAGAKDVLADKQITELKDTVGGEEKYNELMGWAATLPEEYIETFNRMVAQGDPQVAKMAVESLNVRTAVTN